MSSGEADRLTLHQTLRGLMPENVADILMAHLPPVGWSTVATKDDINLLRVEMNHRFTLVDEKFKQIDTRIDRVDSRLDRLETKIDQLASMKRYVVTTGIALAALICGAGAPLWFGGF